MPRVHCQDCQHFLEAPWKAPKTGCYHPELMKAVQSADFLDEQQECGDHEKINLRGDCAKFEARRARPSLWQRFLGWGAA